MTETPSKRRSSTRRPKYRFRDPAVGRRATQAREAQNITMAELARRTGYAQTTIKNWEIGGFTSRDGLEAVARALSVKPADLMLDDRSDLLAPAILSILYRGREEIARVTGLPIEKIRLTFDEHDLDPKLTLSLGGKRRN